MFRWTRSEEVSAVMQAQGHLIDQGHAYSSTTQES